MMRKTWRMAAALAVIIAVPTTGAWAACEPFTALNSGETREITYGDVDGDGSVNPGDKRFGRLLLTDADGQQIGVLHMVATLREVDEDGAPAGLSVEHVYALSDGVLFATRALPTANANFANPENGRGPGTGTRIFTVVGGMDAYAGASGTIEQEPDGLDSAFTFKLTCE